VTISMGRIRFVLGSGGGDRNHAPSPAELAEAARAAGDAHRARIRERLAIPGEVEQLDDLVVRTIEAAVEDGVRRLRLESERLHAELEDRFADLERQLRAAEDRRASELNDLLAAEFSRVYRSNATFHPAAAHLAELNTRIKRMAGELAAVPGNGKYVAARHTVPRRGDDAHKDPLRP
jgi:hypothetical protein